jgi:hypothetical protein
VSQPSPKKKRLEKAPVAASPVVAPGVSTESEPEKPQRHIRTHAVLVVPSLGHSDFAGKFTRGQALGRYSELDIIDAYVATLVEELELDGVRVEVMGTRSRPGIRMVDRHKDVEKYRMVIHCCAGWAEKPDTLKNISTVTCGPRRSFTLANALSEAVNDWGHCYVWGHRSAKVTIGHEDPLLNVDDTLGVRIEPFQLNGPDIETYAAKLPQLGRSIASSISSYLLQRNEGRAGHIIAIGG